MMPARMSMDASARRWSMRTRALMLSVHQASVQDREAARPLLPASRRFIARMFANGRYAGEGLASATQVAPEIVGRKALAGGLGGAAVPMDRGAFPRLDQPRQGLGACRRDPRSIHDNFPVRRNRHDPHAPSGKNSMSY